MSANNETKTTIIFGGAALALALIAFLMAGPGATPDAFLDQGEPFFPEFTDPNSATTLEVIDFDSESGSARPFKVTFAGGLWTIPSHHNYPADGADRLAKTAAGVIGIKKDDFRTDNVAEHAGCNVVDPLDEAATGLGGRGQRITLKSESGSTLADFIVGAEIPGRENFRFVRIPGEKRVYACRMNLDISTNFVDWIDRDLLQIEKERIRKINLDDYSINERTGTIETRDKIALTNTPDGWVMQKTPKGKIVDSVKVANLETAIDSIAIVGVRKKPAGLSASLRRDGETPLTEENVLSMQSKGYFFTRDGALRSNEGEMTVYVKDGVEYTLRFGEVLFGSGLSVSAGSGESDTTGAVENRYLFVSARFVEENYKEPAPPKDSTYVGKGDSLLTDKEYADKTAADVHDSWSAQVKRGRKLAADLNARFADWYYVISADSFEKLRVTRESLLKDNEDS